MQNNLKDDKFKLQFIVDKWMDRQALRPKMAPAKKAKEVGNEQHVSARSPCKRVSSWTSAIGKA